MEEDRVDNNRKEEFVEKEITERVILSVSNSYDKLYYFNEDFSGIPEEVQKDIHVMMVLHTEEVGGILTMGFEEDGKLFIESSTSEYDGYFDHIGSHLKIKEYQQTYADIFEQLEAFYYHFY